jgi:hypothetical protein
MRCKALNFVEKESQTIGGFGRNDRFEYHQRFAGTGEIKNRVFVEAGAIVAGCLATCIDAGRRRA